MLILKKKIKRLGKEKAGGEREGREKGGGGGEGRGEKGGGGGRHSLFLCPYGLWSIRKSSTIFVPLLLQDPSMFSKWT